MTADLAIKAPCPRCRALFLEPCRYTQGARVGYVMSLMHPSRYEQAAVMGLRRMTVQQAAG